MQFHSKFLVIYNFISVVKPSKGQTCTDQKQAYAQSAQGYLSSTLSTAEDDLGSSCPWILSALKGQTINITVIDFHPARNSQGCTPLGYIKDLHNGRDAIICKGEHREQRVYSSAGAMLEVTLENTDGGGNGGTNFLIHFTGKPF